MSKIYVILIFSVVALVGGYVGMVLVERVSSESVGSVVDEIGTQVDETSLSTNPLQPAASDIAQAASDIAQEPSVQEPSVQEPNVELDDDDVVAAKSTQSVEVQAKPHVEPSKPVSQVEISRRKKRSRNRRRAKRYRASRRQELSSDFGKKSQPSLQTTRLQTTNVGGVIMASEPDDNEPVKKPAKDDSSNRFRVGTTPIAEGFDE